MRFKLVKHEEQEYELHRVDINPGRDVLAKYQPQAGPVKKCRIRP